MSERSQTIQEVPIEILRFSAEAREALIQEGYVIYPLSGQSIRALRESGRDFWSTWHRDSRHEDLETKGSRHSEVAIRRDTLFIPKSNNKTLKQQEDMIAKFSFDLGKKIKGVEAIMGEAPDYAELAFAYLDTTRDRLFGEKYGYNFARTKTPTAGSLVALVGNFRAVFGLHVSSWPRDDGDSSVFAFPLVVPAVAKAGRPKLRLGNWNLGSSRKFFAKLNMIGSESLEIKNSQLLPLTMS